MVSSAIRRASRDAKGNIHQLISVLYAKLVSHLFMAGMLRGMARHMDTRTHFSISKFSLRTISETRAPLTFLIPISFLLVKATKADMPSSPIQATIMATIEKRVIKLVWFSREP